MKHLPDVLLLCLILFLIFTVTDEERFQPQVIDYRPGLYWDEQDTLISPYIDTLQNNHTNDKH